MSDDLIKRLRQHRYNTWNDDLGPEPDKAFAADRIEQLQSKLAKAMEVLRWYADFGNHLAGIRTYAPIDLDKGGKAEEVLAKLEVK